MLRRCPDRGGGTPAIGPAARPSVAWTANDLGPALVIGADGTLYAAKHGSDSSSVVATTPDRTSSGDVIWSASTGQRDAVSLAIGRSGTIYALLVGPGGAALDAIRPDGSIAWSTPVSTCSAFADADLAVGNDETLYVLANPGPTCADLSVLALFAFAPDGSSRWIETFGPGQYPQAPFASVGPGGDIYLLRRSTTPLQQDLLAYAPDGSIAWRAGPVPLDSSSAFAVPTAADDGTVYAASEKSLLSLRPDGSTRWTMALPGAPLATLAVGPDGTVYRVDMPSGTIVAIRPDGNVAWTYKAPHQMASGQIIVDGAGRVYFAQASVLDGGTFGDDTVALSPQGDLLWVIPGAGAPVALDGDGTLYTTSSQLTGGLSALRL